MSTAFTDRREDLISDVRIALANIRVPATPDDSVRLATSAVADAGRRGAAVICFPECFIPGYRWPGQEAPPPDPVFLERAWAAVADAARLARIAVVLGTERVTDRGLQITVCVINPDGTTAAWQDKSQIDPSEEGTYPALGTERRLSDPANTVLEKAMLCRAAENTCFFASVNCASEGAGTTSAIIRPDGTLQCHQPYGHEGLLVADLDLSTATGLLASRCRISPM